MPSAKAHITSVRLDEWQIRALQTHAAKQDRSVSYVMSTAINLFLREQGFSPLEDEAVQPALIEAPKPEPTQRAQAKVAQAVLDARAERKAQLAARRRAARYGT